MKRVVTAVELLAVVATIVFVIALFANEPAESPASGASGGLDGATLFADNCATCHGATGDGGIGPPLSDGRMVAVYPDSVVQVAVVTDGRANMPAFGGRLTEEDIAEVVAYTRGL